jgi:membrane protease subunit (stomatin/prohibitin family)
MSFFSKQFIDVIDWTEPEEGILSYRFPMEDREIQNGGKLTVRDSQIAVFVNEGQVADVFYPGLHTLTTQTLPVLTYLRNWDKGFRSPFKSDVFFLSTRLQTDQKWGTANPITLRDKEFGAVRIRAYGIYAYRVGEARMFYKNLSGTVETYRVSDIDGQLRNTIVAQMTDTLANSSINFVDMASSQNKLGQQMLTALRPVFAELGLKLESFVVENVSLPEELQKMLDQRIGMNMVGDLGRFTQFEAAQAIPLAAANPGGSAAGIGVGLGAGAAMAQQMLGSFNLTPAPPAAASPTAAGPGAATKFCINCGHAIPKSAHFCSECGGAQG